MIESKMTEARELAAQCWCDEETKHIDMDTRLAEAFAKRLAPLMMHHVTVARAMNRIREEIHADHRPGSYYHSWLCNIAMPILDQHTLDLRSPTGANAMAAILLEHFWGKPRGATISILPLTEQRIRESKQLRADMDEILQAIKSLPGSPERSIAKRKLTEAIMWLGMDLKEVNASRPKSEQVAGPYPTSYDPTSSRVEPPADGLKL